MLHPASLPLQKETWISGFIGNLKTTYTYFIVTCSLKLFSGYCERGQERKNAYQEIKAALKVTLSIKLYDLVILIYLKVSLANKVVGK
jgi:hypothetical protein